MLHPLRIEFKNKNWIKLTTATKYKLYRAMTNCYSLLVLTSALSYFYKLQSTDYGVRLRKRKDAVIVYVWGGVLFFQVLIGFIA